MRTSLVQQVSEEGVGGERSTLRLVEGQVVGGGARPAPDEDLDVPVAGTWALSRW